MHWAVGALFLLLIGGITGVMLANPAINYTVHNSVFVIAHFHCMVLLIVFAAFAAVIYWWPKVFGFKMDEANGKRFFWTFCLGTSTVFLAMFALGFEGETRRLDYLYDQHWMPMLIIEELGIAFYCLSVYFFFAMLFVTIRDREKNVCGPDPWGTARSLEWLTHSPVPFYNFAVTPQVHELDELTWRRDRNCETILPDHYDPVHMPNSSMIPIFICLLSFAFGFGMVWRIWWMAGGGLAAIIATIIISSFWPDKGYTITPEQMRDLEAEHLRRRAATAAPAPLPLAKERLV
jgi:cytochrome o ubiquinol oxidase subunit 1